MVSKAITLEAAEVWKELANGQVKQLALKPLLAQSSSDR